MSEKKHKSIYRSSEEEKDESMEYVIQSNAADDVIERYGSASKEHLVAYSGVDNETGRTLKRGLKKTSESQLGQGYEELHMRQQAGYSAEDKYTAKQNAERIISGKKERIIRTDDLGRVNDPIYDHILLDERGFEIPGTGEQMKFVGSNPKACLVKLESKQFQKYLDADATITVPSDYYEGIIEESNNRIQQLEQQLNRATKNGEKELAEKVSLKIEKVKKIRDSIKDSGITNKEALFARLHPKLSTAGEIAKISHRAGASQIGIGAAIGGSLSLIRNIVALTKGEKDSCEAAVDLAKDVGKSATTAYATAYAGSALKASAQNSTSTTLRTLSKTNAPAIIVTSAIDISKSLIRFFNGEISGGDCLLEIGEKGTSSISASLFAVAGQALIPIPVVGSIVGSIVGYALSSTFFGCLTTSLREAAIAHEERLRIEKECKAAIEMMERYRMEMKACVNKYFSHYISIFNDAFRQMDKALLSEDIDQFIAGANSITTSLGEDVQFSTMEQFRAFMCSNEEFKL